jgi:cell division protein FtsN
MAEAQTIPARHGVATFVPAGQTIKIINKSGTQVIDTWAFALPKPDPKKGAPNDDKEESKDEKKQDDKKQDEKPATKATPKKKKDAELPSQEEAEKATQDMMKQGEQAQGDAKNATPQKSTWSSYVPSLGLSSKKTAKTAPKKEETQQQKDSRTWSSYFTAGKGFSSYIPKSASDTVSSFAKDVRRKTWSGSCCTTLT